MLILGLVNGVTSHPALHVFLAKHRQRSVTAIETRLKRGIAEGDLPISTNATQLANYFVEKYSNNMTYNITGVNDDIVNKLKKLAWPGNVRMLENVIVRSMLLQEHDGPLETLAYDEEVTTPVSFSQATLPKEYIHSEYIPTLSLDKEVETFERQLIINALNATNGNIAKAAKRLDISRTTLYYKVKKYNLTLCVNEH